MQIRSIDKSKLAKNDDEFKALVESDVDWIARSADDVSQLREAQYGPFGKLPEDDFRKFVASLVFDRGGVVTGSYKPLMGSLTLSELFEVFECFGMNSDFFTRLKDHKCEDQGTVNAQCVFSPFDFCTPVQCLGPA